MIWAFQKIVGIPRIAAIEHPFGRPFGDVGDSATQRQVLEATLDTFIKAKERGHVEHLPQKWPLDPKKTKWHPPKPAPIIAHMRKKGIL